jgi:hypothetical protein
VSTLIELGEEFPDVFVDQAAVTAVYLQKTYTSPHDYYRVVVTTANGREFYSKNRWTTDNRDEAVQKMIAVIAGVTNKGE